MNEVDREISIGGALWKISQDDLTKKISLEIEGDKVHGVVVFRYKDEPVPFQKTRLRRLEIVVEEVLPIEETEKVL